jgi:hypothetical protein
VNGSVCQCGSQYPACVFPRLIRIHAIGARNLFRWDVRTVCGLRVLGCVIPFRTPSLKRGRLEEGGATVEDCGPLEHSTLLRNKFRAPTASFRLICLRTWMY